MLPASSNNKSKAPQGAFFMNFPKVPNFGKVCSGFEQTNQEREARILIRSKNEREAQILSLSKNEREARILSLSKYERGALNI
jgi:hypothetical protein